MKKINKSDKERLLLLIKNGGCNGIACVNCLYVSLYGEDKDCVLWVHGIEFNERQRIVKEKAVEDYIRLGYDKKDLIKALL